MTELPSQLLVDSRCILAEGIQWHAGRARLYWTDIHGSVLWSADADGNDIRTQTFAERVCSFAFDAAGHLLLALESGLHAWDPADGRLARIGQFEPDQARTRMNDGRCDRFGNFVVGGMDETALEPLSSVLRIEPDGTCTTLLSPVGCSNSIAFTPDGTGMYFADTPTGRIQRFEYGRDGLGAAATFAQLRDADGWPDGSCVDAEGGLWNARFNGSRVQRYLPDGTPERAVGLPVVEVTCCCFGGQDLDRLYITTAHERLSAEAAARQPLAGGIFVASPGVAGLPEDHFHGDAFALAE